MSRIDIDKLLSEMNPLRFPETVTVSMFLKREESRQEEEWRLLIRNCETSGMDEFRKHVEVDGPLMRLPLPDAKNFVSEILLGCSVSEDQENMLRNTLVKAGWRAVISRSGVNEKPQFFTSY